MKQPKKEEKAEKKESRKKRKKKTISPPSEKKLRTNTPVKLKGNEQLASYLNEVCLSWAPRDLITIIYHYARLFLDPECLRYETKISINEQISDSLVLFPISDELFLSTRLTSLNIWSITTKLLMTSFTPRAISSCCFLSPNKIAALRSECISIYSLEFELRSQIKCPARTKMVGIGSYLIYLGKRKIYLWDSEQQPSPTPNTNQTNNNISNNIPQLLAEFDTEQLDLWPLSNELLGVTNAEELKIYHILTQSLIYRYNYSDVYYGAIELTLFPPDRIFIKYDYRSEVRYFRENNQNPHDVTILDLKETRGDRWQLGPYLEEENLLLLYSNTQILIYDVANNRSLKYLYFKNNSILKVMLMRSVKKLVIAFHWSSELEIWKF